MREPAGQLLSIDEQREMRDAPLLFQRSDERVVGVEVGDHLEATLQRDDLPFEMPL